VGGFLSGGFDLLTSAGHLIKSAVGTCGIILLGAEVFTPLLSYIALVLLLKGVAAVVQPLGESKLSSLLGEVAHDVEYFLAGLLLVAFLYLVLIMLAIHSATYFL
jgi:stage III sporulation protein AE